MAAIIVWHMKRDMPEDTYRRLILPIQRQDRASVAKQAFAAGFYERVGEVDGTLLEDAFRLTQNGVVSDSWSLHPPVGLTPCEPSFHLIDGQHLGRKSSQVGDIFEQNDTLYLCEDVGFVPLGRTNEIKTGI